MNVEERAALLAKVKDLVGEHCIAFVFCAEVDADEALEDPNAHESVMMSIHDGGPTMLQGMLKRMQVIQDWNEVKHLEREK
jgi:hypothetical protein